MLIGFLIERVAYKPLRSAPRMSIMISAIGVSYLLQNLVLYITGGLQPDAIPRIPFISESMTVFGTATTQAWSRIVTPVLALVILVYRAGHAHQPHQGGHGHARRVQGL